MRVAVLTIGIVLFVVAYLALSGSADGNPPEQPTPSDRLAPTNEESPAPALVPDPPASPAAADAPPPTGTDTAHLIRTVRTGCTRRERSRALKALLDGQRGSPEVVDLLVHLVSDPDPDIQRAAIYATQWVFEKNRALVPALVAAANSPTAVNRDAAVAALGVAAVKDPRARAVILAALEDESEEVRDTAVTFLANIGEAGARKSLELLFTKKMSDGALDDAAACVVEFGLLPEALDRGPDARTAAALLLHLCTNAWEHPEFAKALRGRFASLKSLFVPDHNYGWQHFLEVAEDGGDGYLIRDAALDRSEPDVVRVGAVAATIRRDDFREFFALTGALLAEHGTSEELRLGLVDNLDTMCSRHPKSRKKVVEVLLSIYRSDTSPEVRKAARKAMPGGRVPGG